MHIFVQHADGKSLTIRGHAGWTVEDLKSAVYEKTGIDRTAQVLRYGVKIMKNDQETLGCYGVCDNCNVDLSLRIRGGTLEPACALNGSCVTGRASDFTAMLYLSLIDRDKTGDMYLQIALSIASSIKGLSIPAFLATHAITLSPSNAAIGWLPKKLYQELKCGLDEILKYVENHEVHRKHVKGEVNRENAYRNFFLYLGCARKCYYLFLQHLQRIGTSVADVIISSDARQVWEYVKEQCDGNSILTAYQTFAKKEFDKIKDAQAAEKSRRQAGIGLTSSSDCEEETSVASGGSAPDDEQATLVGAQEDRRRSTRLASQTRSDSALPRAPTDKAASGRAPMLDSSSTLDSDASDGSSSIDDVENPSIEHDMANKRHGKARVSRSNRRLSSRAPSDSDAPGGTLTLDSSSPSSEDEEERRPMLAPAKELGKNDYRPSSDQLLGDELLSKVVEQKVSLFRQLTTSQANYIFEKFASRLESELADMHLCEWALDDEMRNYL
jgi:hypothetical protein